MQDSNESENPGSKLQLTAIEARVLGALMEKQLTTPDAYPLTLNSLVMACNQKTSREPISNYSEGEVHRCVEQLRERRLIDVEYGSRANRLDQRLSRALYLEKPAQALLTILLLRGPQTVNELFSRTQRMVEFSNEHAVAELLDVLCAKTSPIVRKLGRQSGQREDRYAHLLSGEPKFVAVTTDSESTPPKTRARDELEQRVSELESKVERLMKELGLEGE